MSKLGDKDFEEYIIEQLISNIEYDFDLDFYDYVDINNFKKDGGN